jgi:hypothetical protein
MTKHCMCGCIYEDNDCPNCNKVTDKDRIKELEAKLGHYELLWQAYEVEELIKNHSVVSDRLAEKLHKKDRLLERVVDALDAIKLYSSCGDSRRKAIETLADIKGENK